MTEERSVVWNPETEAALSAARSEVLTSLELFLSHTKYTVTLMTTAIAAGVATMAYGVGDQRPNTQFYGDFLPFLACVIFLVVAGLSVVSLRIIRRYYKIYASNYIYSARVHALVERHPRHPWNEDLERTGSVADPFAPDAVERFMANSETTEKNSWAYYKFVVNLIGACSALLAVFALVVALAAR